MSVCQSVCTCVCMYACQYPPVFLSVNMSICPSVSLSVSPSVCMCICLSFRCRSTMEVYNPGNSPVDPVIGFRPLNQYVAVSDDYSVLFICFSSNFLPNHSGQVEKTHTHTVRKNTSHADHKSCRPQVMPLTSTHRHLYIHSQ